MELFECIELRRSIRVFTDQSVSVDETEKILDAARLAPSAGNIQPWEFVVVRKRETKQKLAETALGQVFIEESSVVIIVSADENRSERVFMVTVGKIYIAFKTLQRRLRIFFLQPLL